LISFVVAARSVSGVTWSPRIRTEFTVILILQTFRIQLHVLKWRRSCAYSKETMVWVAYTNERLRRLLVQVRAAQASGARAAERRCPAAMSSIRGSGPNMTPMRPSPLQMPVSRSHAARNSEQRPLTQLTLTSIPAKPGPIIESRCEPANAWSDPGGRCDNWDTPRSNAHRNAGAVISPQHMM